jgi:RND family efflux transporter MFP subunit
MNVRLLRIGVTVCVFTAFIANACRRAAPAENVDDESDVVAVAAQPARSGSLRAVVRVTGVVVPADGAEFLLVAPETARVLEITKAEGDTVASGEVLARFELSTAVQNLSRQQSELARLEAQLESARVAQARARDFVARGLIPRLDLEAADRELSDAQASVDRAGVLYKAAETAAARAVISAPFDGVVAARFHNPGDVVQAAATDPVLRIVDPTRLEILASVPAADASRVLPGASARMADPRDGSNIRLSVGNRSAIAASAGSVPVRLPPMDPLTVAVDTSVAIEIDAEERSGVVFVPPEALIQDGGRSIVMVAVDSRAEKRPVTIGITTDAGTEITSGLNAGELVIVQGHIGLADGTDISVAITR